MDTFVIVAAAWVLSAALTQKVIKWQAGRRADRYPGLGSREAQWKRDCKEDSTFICAMMLLGPIGLFGSVVASLIFESQFKS